MLFALIAGSLVYLGLMKWPKQPLPRSTSIPNALTMQKERTVKSVVYLYFINKDNSFLAAEKRELLHSRDATNLAKTIVNALITGPKELVRTLPADTELRALFINQGKTAYVDFNESLQANGIQSELFTIYSIVNSLVLNIPEIENVKLLVAGRETVTLAGHIDTRFHFKAHMLLVR
jgi:spore germination protein GerM